MWLTSQNESLSSYLSQLNVLHMESKFTGVVASDVMEKENIGREIRADDIKTMSLSGKIEETLQVNSIEINLMTIPIIILK